MIGCRINVRKKVDKPNEKAVIKKKVDVDWAEVYCNWSTDIHYKEAYNLLEGYSPEVYSPNVKIPASDLNCIIRELDNIGADRNYEGLLVSYAANNLVTENEIYIEVERPLGFLGFRNNGKEWVIKGNVGYYIGESMKSGSIKVEGNAQAFVGAEMEGGTILIEGNANGYLGYLMKGGTIRVNGDAGSDTGWLMKGGEIHVLGKIKALGRASEGTGKIYNKGKLVSENARWVNVS